jgi:hypothetical protein
LVCQEGTGGGIVTDEQEIMQLQTYIRNLFGNAIDLSPDSPHAKAVRWMALDDFEQLTAGVDATFLQRYVLVLFYYQTGPWRSCNPAATTSCLYQEFGRDEDDTIVYTGVPATRWLSGTSECEWVGVVCALGDVVGVELCTYQARFKTVSRFSALLINPLCFPIAVGQDLTGTIPTEFVMLPGFQDLSLAYNFLTGTIPPSFGGLPELRSFEVHGNLLSGSIPNTYFTGFNQLIVFNVGDNLLSGPIPTEIGSATTLAGIHIFENALSGVIPSQIGLLTTALAYTRMNANNFRGALPTEFGSLSNLIEVWLSGNQFTSTIPSDFGWLPNLRDLRLTDNQLSGEIPTEIYQLTALEILRLDSNRLVGTLSPQIGFLGALEQLRLSRNDMSGMLPMQLRALSNLVLGWFHVNSFTGAMPVEVCDLPNLRFLQTDCLEIECVCCTACCVDGSDCTAV